MTIAEINAEVCKGLGVELDCGDLKHVGAGYWKIVNHVPTLTEQISVPCKECMGYGLEIIGCTDDGRPEQSGEDCPSCHGDKTRLITRLQSILEERSEWGHFWMHLCQKHAHHFGEEFFEIFTNAHALLRAYWEYKGGKS